MKSAQIFPPPQKKPTNTSVEKFVEEESRILYSAKSVFPFSLFPDRIIIHPNKVEVIIGEFFKSNYTKTFFIEDIGGVEIVTTPFMAALKISGNKMGLEPIIIKNFKRKDAITIKEIIDGMMISQKQEHKLSKMKSKEAIPNLQKAGETHEEK